MKTWEYIVIGKNLRYPASSIEETLNEVGRMGWELVSVVESEGLLIFKREVKK